MAIKALLATLFLLVQGIALFDAAAHGDAPHEHYGVSCELTVAVKADVAPLPLSPALPKPPRERVLIEQAAIEFQPWSHPPGRAPPPRSPPALHQ